MVATQGSSAPTIVVFGATGVQGGSVINHLIQSDKPYRILAVTRDPSKPSAKQLEEKGVTPIKADLGNEAELKAVFNKADYVFCVTNFWESGGEKELENGKRVMDVAKATNVKRVFWSGLSNATKLSGGKYKHVEHFDGKAEILEYGKSLGVPLVDVQPAAYMENHLTMMPPKKQPDGTYAFYAATSANSTQSVINCGRDYGAWVRGALEADISPGSEVLACGEELTGSQMAQQWGEVLGQKCNWVELSGEESMKAMGQELTEMQQYIGEFGYYGGHDYKPSFSLAKQSKPQTWREFVDQADWSKVLV